MDQPPELKDAVGPKRLAGKVTTILQRIEKELDQVDVRIGDSMHILDADNDGLVGPSALRSDTKSRVCQRMRDPMHILDADSDGLVGPQPPPCDIKSKGYQCIRDSLHVLDADNDGLVGLPALWSYKQPRLDQAGRARIVQGPAGL